MVSLLLGLPPDRAGWGHCVVFLGKAFYSHSASLKLDVKIVTGKLNKKKNTLIADTITGNPVVYIVGYKTNKYYK